MSHTAEHAYPLTDAQHAQWRDDGYLLLREVIDKPVIDGMCAVFAAVVDRMLAQLKDEGVIDELGEDLPLETRFAKVAGAHAGKFGRSWRNAIRSPELYDLHLAPKLVDVMTQLIDGEVLGHPVWNARPKMPSQQLTVVPWHQDSSYFGEGSDKSQIITVWIPLVEATKANGCLQVMPGSHKLGLLTHHQEDREGKFLEVSQAVDPDKAVTCEMQPGDALIFDNLMLHQSLANVTDVVRWSVDIRYYRGGDWIGGIGWPSDGFEWVIHSTRRRATSRDAWLVEAEKMGW